MYSVMFVLYRKAGMTHEEFTSYWREVHAPLVAELPGLRRYRIAPVAPDSVDVTPFAGVAELWFDSQHAWQRALESPAGQKALGDVVAFQERSEGAHVVPEIVVDRTFAPET
ncbi:MAG: EthD family reductase [Firmicutes bacterium]|nr:EthD family reductase [Bacillota bacterium]